MDRQRLRRVILALHLWLGLAVGTVLALAALTGSALVFYPEIDRLLVPAQRVAPDPAPPRLDRVVAALRQGFPERQGEWRLELPRAPGEPVVGRHATPPEETGRRFAPLMVAVDPQDGRILAARRWGETAMTWIYDLHYILLAGETGRLVLALTGLASLLLLVSGVWLWWPAPGKRLRGIVPPRLRPGAARRVFDLHVLGGLYGGVVLLPLVATGVVLERPDWFGAPPHHVHPDEGGVPMSPELAMRIARSRFPEAEPRWVDVPPPGGGITQVRLYQPGEPGRRFPKTSVWVGADGQILNVEDARRRSFRDAFFAWQHPLHNGEAFGLPGRVAAAVAGLAPPLLLVTGIIRWRQKRRARSQAASGRTAGPAPDAASARRD